MSDKTDLKIISTLLLSAIVGLSLSATFITLFNSAISFSIFPVISLILAIYCLHQRYLHNSVPDGAFSLIVLSFISGFFAYMMLIRVEFAMMGSNTIPTFIFLAAFFGLLVKLRKYKSIQ